MIVFDTRYVNFFRYSSINLIQSFAFLVFAVLVVNHKMVVEKMVGGKTLGGKMLQRIHFTPRSS